MTDAERRKRAEEWVKAKTQHVAALWPITSAGLSGEEAQAGAVAGGMAAFLAGCEAESESLSSVMVALDTEARELRRKLARAESQAFNLATLSSPKPAAHRTAPFPGATLLMYHAPGWTYSYTAPPTCGECDGWREYPEQAVGTCRPLGRARYPGDPPVPHSLCTFTPRPPKPEPEPRYSVAYADHGADDGFEAAIAHAYALYPTDQGYPATARVVARHVWDAARRSQAKGKQPGEES